MEISQSLFNLSAHLHRHHDADHHALREPNERAKFSRSRRAIEKIDELLHREIKTV
jgi:hypothetical protein